MFFFIAHGWIYREYRGRLKDRQEQINLLAKDNREWRKMFADLLKQELRLKKKGEN